MKKLFSHTSFLSGFVSGIVAIVLCCVPAYSFLVSGQGGAPRPAKTSSLRIQKLELRPGDFTCTTSGCQSAVVHTDFSFSSLALEWGQGDTPTLQMMDNNTWSAPITLEGEVDAPDSDLHPSPSQILFAHHATDFKITTPHRPTAVIHAAYYTLPSSNLVKAAVDAPVVDYSFNNPFHLALVSRGQWLDSSIELTQAERDSLWPTEYQPIQKFVVHHTATNLKDVNGDGVIDKSDYQELVRAIYTYHARIRGWGDIGYQYIIDPLGNVYESKYGGDGIVGGHTYRDAACSKFGKGNIGFNQGSIGIAMLGSFDSQAPTAQAQDALTSLLAQKAWEWNVDPVGSGFFKDQSYPNIIGHRDLDCTSCPGNATYAALEQIRQTTKQKLDGLSSQRQRVLAATPLSTIPAEVALKTGETQTMHVQIKNTGTLTWHNYGAQKIYIAREGITTALKSLNGLSIAVESKGETTAPAAAPVDIQSLVAGTLQQANVHPGEVGDFVITVDKAPQELYSKRSYMLALGDRGWLPGISIDTKVINNGLEYAATLDPSKKNLFMLDNPYAYLTLKFQNRGTKEWKKGEMKLTFPAQAQKAVLLAGVGKSKEQIITNSNTVKPGEFGEFKVGFKTAALIDTTYSLAVYKEGQKVSGSDYDTVRVVVRPSYQADVVDIQTPQTLEVKKEGLVAVTLKNTGQLSWNSASLKLFNEKDLNRSAFYASSWKGITTPEKTGVVKPGQTVTAFIHIKAPALSGKYTQRFELMQGTRQMYLQMPTGTSKEYRFTVSVEKPKPLPKKVVTPVKK